MTIEAFRTFLGWGALINIGMVLWWWLFLVFFHDFCYRLHTRWFKFSDEIFDVLHYSGIAFYEILVWAFFIMPWLALHISVGGGGETAMSVETALSIDIVRTVLGWSALLHIGLILLWWLLLLCAHDAFYRLHTRWFKMSPETFDAIHYSGIGFYKILLWGFFITPWLALHIIT